MNTNNLYTIDEDVKLGNYPMKIIPMTSPAYPLTLLDMNKDWMDDLYVPPRNIFIPAPANNNLYKKSAPENLYVMGNEKILMSEKMIAVVGTRFPSRYGEAAAKTITEYAVEENFIIVSGMAYGIDTISHQTCLRYGGKTIAVLPMGLDDVYPRANRDLAKHIIMKGGCLVSITPPRTKYRKSLFAERNAIQTGLSSIVVIVECNIKSGTMHTYRFAKKQQRYLAVMKYDESRDTKSEGNKEIIECKDHDFIIRTKRDLKKLLTTEFEENLHKKL